MTKKTRETTLVETIGRKETRYPANAQVWMEDAGFVLKDASLNGGCVQCGYFPDIVPNGNYTLTVIPEEESRIEGFEIEIVSRWMRMKRTGFETGFIIVVPPGNKAVERYIEFLKLKNTP
jgi:hypothetical protein